MKVRSFLKSLFSKKETNILERLETYTVSPDVDQYLWENWYQLKESIDTFLTERGVVRASDLTEILPVHRLAALDRYISHHTEGDFAYNRQKKELVLRPFSRIKEFLKLWDKVLKRWDKSIYGAERHAKDLDKLIGLLATALGFTVIGTRTRYLDVFGYVVDTSTLHLGNLEQVPLLVLNRRDRLDDVVSETQDVVRLLGTARLFSLIITLSSSDKLRMQFVNSPFVREYVVLSRENLLKTLTSKNPIRVLRSLILEQVDLLTISPFVTVGPTSDRMFFGREKEIQELVGRVHSRPYAIIGGRRVGKTSILGRLHRVRLPAIGFRTVYHDCSTTSNSSTFLTSLIRAWRPMPSSDTLITFGDLLQSPPNDKPLVLIMDEADKIVPVDCAEGWPLFNTLRALVSTGRAQVILSGERTLREALHDPTSPLFNFAQEMLLGPLSFRAVEELVIRPMKQLEIELADEKTIVDRIWTFTSGHPNIVQRLCRRLIEHINEQGTRRITLDDVNVVIEDPGFQRDDFLNTFWENATLLERIMSLLLAQADQQPYSLRDARHLLDQRLKLTGPDGEKPSGIQVDAALGRLADLRSILERTPQGYTFAVSAFPRVVTQPNVVTIDDLFEMYSEAYSKYGDLTLDQVEVREQGR